MKKITLFFGFLLMFLSLSLTSVSAQTVGELQARINALMAQLKALQSSSSPTPAVTSNAFCYTFNRNFGIGSSGNEVVALVQALSAEGFTNEVGSSENYDENLASAVSAFQEKYRSEVLAPAGLRSGTGYVGAHTRVKLNKLYKCGIVVINPTNSVVINGVSGPQSLNTNQVGTWTVSAYSSNGANLSYSVKWGDESTYWSVGSAVTSPASSQSATFTHIYSQAGTYTPTFTVTSQNTIVCIMAPCPSNDGSAEASLSVKVSNLGTDGPVTVLSPNGGETLVKGTNHLISWNDNINIPFCENCGAPVPKTYDLKLVPYRSCTVICPAIYLPPLTIAKGVSGSNYNWSVGAIVDFNGGSLYGDAYTIQVCRTGTAMCDSSDSYFNMVTSGSANSSPKIGLINIPQNIIAGEQVNFSFSATDANNDYLFWSIYWGDIGSIITCPLFQQVSTNQINWGYSWNYSASHVWKTPGIYTVTVHVNDCKGGSDKSTFTVNVVGAKGAIPKITNYPYPSSGPVGTQVTIIGTGFTPTGNKIKFGNQGTEYNPDYSLNSKDGTTLVFTVPYSDYYACQFPTLTGSVIVCALSNAQTRPGIYSISVVNANGTSNFMNFSVTSAGTSVCALANPPVGYHYEGIQPYPICGGYLVKD